MKKNSAGPTRDEPTISNRKRRKRGITTKDLWERHPDGEFLQEFVYHLKRLPPGAADALLDLAAHLTGAPARRAKMH